MSPQIASLRLCKVTSIAFVWLFSTVRLKCLLNELWSAQAKSHGLHSFDFSPVWVFKCVFKWPACSLRGYKVTLVAFVWFFSTVRFQMFTERAWVSAGKVTQDAFFCVRYQIWSSKCLYVNHTRLLDSFCFSYKVRATISRMLCFSISISLQFGVAHGQVLLYVGHHQVLHMNLSCKHIHFHF